MQRLMWVSFWLFMLLSYTGLEEKKTSIYKVFSWTRMMLSMVIVFLPLYVSWRPTLLLFEEAQLSALLGLDDWMSK